MIFPTYNYKKKSLCRVSDRSRISKNCLVHRSNSTPHFTNVEIQVVTRSLLPKVILPTQVIKSERGSSRDSQQGVVQCKVD